MFTLVDIPLDDQGIDISSNTIFAYTKLTTTENDVKQLIASLKNIEIKSVETTSISVLVKVPVGHENNQIKRASKHKNINNAELTLRDGSEHFLFLKLNFRWQLFFLFQLLQ